MEKEPLYPFGFGLSYTAFRYESLTFDTQRVGPEQGVVATVTVSNSGPRESDEIVQLYLHKDDASVRVPIQQLCGFTRVSLAAGERRAIELRIKPEQLMIVNDAGERVFEPGRFTLTAGGASPGPRALACGAAIPVQGKLELGA
jgi:beta-glucosidase